jgi:hypothetical protein
MARPARAAPSVPRGPTAEPEMKNFAFDSPVVLSSATATPIETAEQAASVLREHLRSRFTMAGLSALLMLERALECAECEAAQAVFLAWASSENLLALQPRD